MKWILSGIALVALLSACDDSSTDGANATEEDSGPSNPAADDDGADDDEPADDDGADDDEPAADDDGADDDGDDDQPAEDGGGVPPAPTIPPPPEPITCGDVDCPAPPFGTPCCATAEDVEAQASINEGACGVDLSPVFGGPSQCVEFNQPGELDESCPAMEIPDAPPIPGCCTIHGFCGTADTFIGIGCTTPPPEFAEPIPCGDGAGDAGTGSPAGDAGTSADAGDEPVDSGATSDPMPDGGIDADASAGDASL